MIYLFIFILLLLFSWIEIKGLFKKNQKACQVIIIAIFIFIAGFRYETGVDWAGYQYYFDQIAPLDSAFKLDNYNAIFLTLDVGFALFNSIVKMFGGDLQTIFIIVSITSNLLLLKNLRYNTKYVMTGLLIYYSFYFFIFDMSGLRQGLALQVIFYAFRFIENKNLKKYTLFILLAGSIHWTAYLLFILYFFINRDFSKYYYFIIFFFVIFFTLKIGVIGKVIPSLNVFLSGNALLSGKVSGYTTGDSMTEARSWNVYSIFNFIRIFLLIVVLKRIKLKDKTIIFYSNLLLLEFICYFGLYELNDVSERLRFYFTLSELVLIPYIVSQARSYFIKDIYYLSIIIIAFFNSIPFILQFPSTVAYHPYQNYIIYKVLDIKSTGAERLRKHAETH